MPKYTGKAVVATFATIPINPKSKSIEITGKGNEIDVTTQEDAALNAKDYLAGPTDREIKINWLDAVDSDDSLYYSIQIGDTGDIVIQPQGVAATKPKDTYANCTCTGRDVTYPTDGSGPVAGVLTFRAGAETNGANT